MGLRLQTPPECVGREQHWPCVQSATWLAAATQRMAAAAWLDSGPVMARTARWMATLGASWCAAARYRDRRGEIR